MAKLGDVYGGQIEDIEEHCSESSKSWRLENGFEKMDTCFGSFAWKKAVDYLPGTAMDSLAAEN